MSGFDSAQASSSDSCREHHVTDRDDVGEWLVGLVGAEIALVEHRTADAIALAESTLDSSGSTASRDAMTALELIARAHLEAGDLEAAAAAADRTLAMAEPVGFGTLVWRARMVKALARGESTAEAEAEFRTLADRISEPELRWWFERQPLAPN